MKKYIIIKNLRFSRISQIFFSDLFPEFVVVRMCM